MIIDPGSWLLGVVVGQGAFLVLDGLRALAAARRRDVVSAADRQAIVRRLAELRRTRGAE